VVSTARDAHDQSLALKEPQRLADRLLRLPVLAAYLLDTQQGSARLEPTVLNLLPQRTRDLQICRVTHLTHSLSY
jgi:hypothetical protein